MSLLATRERKLDVAIDNNNEPYRSKTNNLLLRLDGKSYATLQGSSGSLTSAGRYYYGKSGQAPPDEFDAGTIQQRGATEYLVRNGKARVHRLFKAATTCIPHWASATSANTPRPIWSTCLVSSKSPADGARAANAQSHTPLS